MPDSKKGPKVSPKPKHHKAWDKNDFKYTLRCCCHVVTGCIIICLAQFIIATAEILYAALLLSGITKGYGDLNLPYIVVLRIICPFLLVIGASLVFAAIWLTVPGLIIPEILIMLVGIAALVVELVWAILTFHASLLDQVIGAVIACTIGAAVYLWFIYVFYHLYRYLKDKRLDKYGF